MHVYICTVCVTCLRMPEEGGGFAFLFLFLNCVCMWRSEKIQVSVLGWLICLPAEAISLALTISLH